MLMRPVQLAVAPLPVVKARTRSVCADISRGRGNLCIIDVSNLLYRMHFAMPPMTAPGGEPVHAVLGFCNKLIQLREVFPDHHFINAFDGGRCDFRTEMLGSYKATRKAMPADLRVQFKMAREASVAFGVPALEQAGFEADDVIATCVAAARAQGLASVSIVTSDKDLMQLASGILFLHPPTHFSHMSHPTFPISHLLFLFFDSAPADRMNVTVFDDKKKRLMDHEAIFKTHGVRPDQFVDYLSLTGDTSDCVPGVPGVGPKTAASLLATHGTLDGVLESAATTMRKSKKREALLEYGEQARLARRLVTLHDTVPLAG